jgi:hypothetical protein
MAKRVAQDERPYRPVEEALVRAVMSHQEAEPVGETVDTEGVQSTNGSLEATPTDLTMSKTVLPEVQRNDRMVVQASTGTVEKLTREKRVLLSASEEREIEHLVSRIAGELGTPVKLSHVLRAYMILLLHAENEIMKRARQSAPLHRPPNGDPVALASFEQRLAQILLLALREARPLR